MGSKKRTIMTILFMASLTILLIYIYNYNINRTRNQKEAIATEKTEVEILLDKDFEHHYPDTPREVVKIYSNMVKCLYSGIEDEEVEQLAFKIRQLYDEELINNNPEQMYIRNLYTEIAASNKAGRSITNFILDTTESVEKSIVDNQELAKLNVLFTIQDTGKRQEIWRFLLRKNEEEKWKILGWDIQPKE